jgi:hypothetical protein
MPFKLPDHTKSLVIQQWLQGVQRDLIAAALLHKSLSYIGMF